MVDITQQLCKLKEKIKEFRNKPNRSRKSHNSPGFNAHTHALEHPAAYTRLGEEEKN